MGKKHILGNDRGLMMLCRDIRRRWLQYGENRRVYSMAKGKPRCQVCRDVTYKPQIDHVTPLGPRPRVWEALGAYAKAMFERKCQALCKNCHKEKTDEERQARKKV